MQGLLIAALLFLAAALVQAVEPPTKSACEDSIPAVATVVPGLDSPLYHETKTSLNWWIVENEDGSVEDTTDGEIGPDDLARVEHTANCTSTHQGEHVMEFCHAVREGDSVRLNLSGGLPAYASSLGVTIDPDLKFRCSFSATYPARTGALRWKIIRKELRLKSPDFIPGHRVYGWISVTFEEEEDGSGRPPRTHTIEGYFKPVVQHKAEW
jgi:hypothetical protein